MGITFYQIARMCFLTGALMLSSSGLQAQSQIGIDLGLGGDPETFNEWNRENQYWRINYDQCRGRIDVAFFMFIDGDADEVATVDVKIKANGSEQTPFRYSFYYTTGGFKQVESASEDNIYIKEGAGLSNLHFYQRNINNNFHQVVEFSYNLAQNEFGKNVEVVLDALVFNGGLGATIPSSGQVSRSFTTNPPLPPVSAPLVSKLPNNTGFTVQWDSRSTCDGKTANELGAFLELLRTGGGNTKVVTTSGA